MIATGQTKTVEELFAVKSHAAAILSREANGEPWFTAADVGKLPGEDGQP